MFGIGDKKPVENLVEVDPARVVKDTLKAEGITLKGRIELAHKTLYGDAFEINQLDIDSISKKIVTYEIQCEIFFTTDEDVLGFVKMHHSEETY